MALDERSMVPDDQLAILSITKTIVAAQVMQLVEAGMLGLDDLAADRLPPDLEFDTNGARIIDLLSVLLVNVSRHPCSMFSLWGSPHTSLKRFDRPPARVPAKCWRW